MQNGTKLIINIVNALQGYSFQGTIESSEIHRYYTGMKNKITRGTRTNQLAQENYKADSLHPHVSRKEVMPFFMGTLALSYFLK